MCIFLLSYPSLYKIAYFVSLSVCILLVWIVVSLVSLFFGLSKTLMMLMIVRSFHHFGQAVVVLPLYCQRSVVHCKDRSRHCVVLLFLLTLASYLALSLSFRLSVSCSIIVVVKWTVTCIHVAYKSQL